MSAKPRPALRYHGGKWRLAPWIISHFPAHRVYVEPYGGGGSVLLRKPRSYAEVYNDLDGDIVNFFRVLRHDGEKLREKLELTPFARDEFNQAYEPTEDPLERARRTVIRSFMGFGSAACTQVSLATTGAGFKPDTGYRANSNRSGTTPAHDWANYPDKMGFLIERIQGVVIENRSATQVMNQQDSPATLHYVDPPYVHSTRGLKQWRTPQSYRHEMSDDDHREMAACLHSLKGMVILSGYRCDLYDELFAKWRRVDKDAHADGARDRVESLWFNSAAEPRTLFS